METSTFHGGDRDYDSGWSVGGMEDELGAYGTPSAHISATRGKPQRQRGGGNGASTTGKSNNNNIKIGSHWTSALQSAVSSTPTSSERVISIPTGICHPTKQQNKYNRNNGANKQTKNGATSKKSPSFSFPDDPGEYF